MGRGQDWNQEVWLLALATTLGSFLTVLSPSFLNCKIRMITSTHRIVGRLDKARDWGLAPHKGNRYLH